MGGPGVGGAIVNAISVDHAESIGPTVCIAALYDPAASGVGSADKSSAVVVGPLTETKVG